jgi:hypothetical protein
MLVAICIKLGGLSDDDTKARFSHTALHNRRRGSLGCVFEYSTVFTTHLPEDEYRREGVYGKAENMPEDIFCN